MPWPKGKPRGPRASVPTQEAVHEPVRQAAKPKAGAVDMSQWDDFEYASQDGNDRLRIPAEHIPDGMDYQWVTDSILGQPQPQRRAQFEMTGWRPVPSERHDGMFTQKGYHGEINVDGLVLMERPLKYSLAAKDRDRRNARQQVWAKEQQIRGGDMRISDAFDSQHKTVRNTVNKSYEPIPVPEK